MTVGKRASHALSKISLELSILKQETVRVHLQRDSIEFRIKISSPPSTS